ncbi:MAG TPA: hypothetical protein VK837_08215 [Longimicrobiales bacterium]|nr:hypothetical protein [Longimicrobiales bacterium]
MMPAARPDAAPETGSAAPATAATLLRAAGVALLLAVALLGADALAAGAGGRAVPSRRGDPADGAAGWAAAIIERGTAPLARRDADAPSPSELEALAALASTRPLAVALPAARPTLALDIAGPLARGRRGALTITARGPAGGSRTAVVTDDAGARDTVSVLLDGDGVGTAGLSVHPATAGWRRWTAVADGDTATAAAWVEDRGPPPVAVWGGAGGWETRFVARALEEAGFPVAIRVHVGRAGRIEGGSVDAGTEDVYLILPGARVDAGDTDRLARRVTEEGAGLLVVGGAAPELAAALGLGGAVRPAPGEPSWALPADMQPPAPRPAAAEGAALLGMEPPAGATVAGRTSDGSAVLLLRRVGRGRAAWSGVEDTWRARLGGGAVDAHRAFWVALADWLAAGRLAGAAYGFVPATPAPGSLIRVALPEGDTVAAPAVAGPDGRRASAAGPFVAADTGLYALVGAAGDTLLATRVEAGEHVPAGFGRAALLAHGSGGAALPTEELADWLEGRGGRSRPAGRLAAWLALAAAVLGLLLGWGLRRLAGVP